ncbi:MAG TPA: hypothetical protein PLL10_06490, partial [Elusimicrobiales bacterium]|nr:hypothetical protein [Elusimicrobiales bacterium]
MAAENQTAPTYKLAAFFTRLLPKESFARGVAVLAGGTAIGQGLVLALSPVVSRLYTPDDFGTLAVYASFLGIATVIVSLRYEIAIPLPEDDKVAANLLGLSLLLALAAGVGAGLLV